MNDEKGKSLNRKKTAQAVASNRLGQLAPATTTMNNEEQSNAPEQYFTTIDEDDEVSGAFQQKRMILRSRKRQ